MRRSAVLLVAALGLAACPAESTPTAAPTPAPQAYLVRAGFDDPSDLNVAVTEFLPEDITIPVGTTVNFQITGPELHSVTFYPEALPRPDPVDINPSQTAQILPEAPYDGTSIINSGLRPQGPVPPEPFEVTFDTVGTFGYFCLIHPDMTGTVEVVPDEAPADTPADILARGGQELEEWLAEGRFAKIDLLKAVLSEPNDDGSRTWIVETGVTTEHTTINAFSAPLLEVSVGDHVRFVNTSLEPHTATFAGDEELPLDPGDPERALYAVPGPGPQALTTTGYFNTGWLTVPIDPGAELPSAGQQYEYVISAVGEYPYVCLLHIFSGMTATIAAG